MILLYIYQSKYLSVSIGRMNKKSGPQKLRVSLLERLTQSTNKNNWCTVEQINPQAYLFNWCTVEQINSWLIYLICLPNKYPNNEAISILSQIGKS